jgi:hypothetical protein
VPPQIPSTPRAAHASAVGRLAAAREKLARAQRLRFAVTGTRFESYGTAVAGSARAEVAMREEWLHWVDEGRSTRPEADGEWGLQPDDPAATAPGAGRLPGGNDRCPCRSPAGEPAPGPVRR